MQLPGMGSRRSSPGRAGCAEEDGCPVNGYFSFLRHAAELRGVGCAPLVGGRTRIE